MYIADLPYPKIYDAVKPQDTIAIQVFHDRVTLAAKNGVVEKTNNYPETGLANFSDWMWAGAACLLVSAIIFRRSLGGAKA